MFVSLFRDLVIPSLVQMATFYTPVQDIAWQQQFRNALNPARLISTLGVHDDSGTSDNTTALNNLFSTLDPSTPIIVDCPNGGYISYSGTWIWPSNLTVWQKPGCRFVSTQVTYGGWAIQQANGFLATVPITNVQYYGFQFGFATVSNADRVMELWVDHFKFKYFDINGSGGFTFLRGSDQEIAYGSMENTYTVNGTPVAGNPGIRQFGNIPKVQTSPGMKANNWYHHLRFSTGDAAFQTCQPGANSATWGWNVSSDDILYENSYAPISGSVILINEPASQLDPTHYAAYTYTCTNIKYINVSGIGYSGAIIGDSNNLTDHVLISGGTIGTYNGNEGGVTMPVIGVGAFAYGALTATAPNTHHVTIQNVSISGYWQTALGVNGAFDTNIVNPIIAAPRVGVNTTPVVEILNSTRTSVTGGSIAVGNDQYGILEDNGSVNTVLDNNVITGLKSPTTRNGVLFPTYGIYHGSSSGLRSTNNTVLTAIGATPTAGIFMTSNPNGTTGATVQNNNVSALPSGLGVICATTGQSNVVTNNTGATDCAP